MKLGSVQSQKMSIVRIVKEEKRQLLRKKWSEPQTRQTWLTAYWIGNWPTGELIGDRLLVLEASSLAVLDNMPDQVIPQKYVELPHSVTFTSAPLGTMTMRKPSCCR